jgi:hypothetical protein
MRVNCPEIFDLALKMTWMGETDEKDAIFLLAAE